MRFPAECGRGQSRSLRLERICECSPAGFIHCIVALAIALHVAAIFAAFFDDGILRQKASK